MNLNLIDTWTGRPGRAGRLLAFIYKLVPVDAKQGWAATENSRNEKSNPNRINSSR